MNRFGKRSEQRLIGVHKDLVKVVRRALEISEVDLSVIEGVRLLSRQKELVAKGKSKTMNSRHLTGHAIDVVPYPLDWNDIASFKKVGQAMKQASKELNIDIEWGGDWRTFKDYPHYQLSWGKYPK